MNKLSVAVLALFMLALALRAVAGTTGAIAGSVVDSCGRPVPGATVVARSTADVATARSDARGGFVFVSLAPGTYAVTISAPGYVPTVYPGRPVFADAESTLEARLVHPSRLVAILDGVHWGFLVARAPGDGYRLTRDTTPFYDLGDRITGALRFVPGVAFGSGTVLQQ